jgi:hypothetical protein
MHADEGYVELDGKTVDENADFKMKSRIMARDLNVTLANGKKVKNMVYEKRVVFWGEKYALKAKAERAEYKKTHGLAAYSQKYTHTTSYDAAKYVKNLKFIKKSGEIVNVKEHPVFDGAKVMEEEKYDSY